MAKSAWLVKKDSLTATFGNYMLINLSKNNHWTNKR